MSRRKIKTTDSMKRRQRDRRIARNLTKKQKESWIRNGRKVSQDGYPVGY